MNVAASLDLRQPSLPGLCPITDAVVALSHAGDVDERGAIFTRTEVVEFMLDLCGYTADQPLHRRRLLEPSFGAGDFLLPAVDRLMTAWNRDRPHGDAPALLQDAIRAVELHRGTFESTRAALLGRLADHGIEGSAATGLADRWLISGDFLLVELRAEFDWVIGNPPYVRQELVPDVLMAEYRSRYTTIYDRADLYVPFIERSLRMLNPRGVLAFICADRWMKNRYGARLRELIATDFHLRAYVDMTGTNAFQAEVAAYPAITLLARGRGRITRVARSPTIESSYLADLAQQLNAVVLPTEATLVSEVPAATDGDAPWVLDGSAQRNLLRRLEARFPTLEEAGCRVGIGVATGSDKSFIGPFAEMDVEDSRKLPIVLTRDIQSGQVVWQGNGVVNPFVEGPGSGLVDLDDYPRLRAYLEARKPDIARRHVAQRSPANWYRTIDRITPSLAGTPKLLIPDIKGEAQVVFEAGQYYPHHNLYYVTSAEWDLRALQAVLLSSVARLFVASYSTRMRGGFLRFQAQYLRRIRLPRWGDVPLALRSALSQAAERLDMAACNEVVVELYGVGQDERLALQAEPSRP